MSQPNPTTSPQPDASREPAGGGPDFRVPEFCADPGRAHNYNPPIAIVPSGGCVHTGISMRDYFAARAVAGVVANSEAVHASAEPTLSCLAANDGQAAAWIAAHAYAIADAMLAERQKPIRQALSRATPSPGPAGVDGAATGGGAHADR